MAMEHCHLKWIIVSLPIKSGHVQWIYRKSGHLQWIWLLKNVVICHCYVRPSRAPGLLGPLRLSRWLLRLVRRGERLLPTGGGAQIRGEPWENPWENPWEDPL